MINEAYFSHIHEKNNLPSIHHSEIQMALGGACGRMFCHKENGKGSDILPRNLSPMSTRYLSALLNTFTYKKLNILNTRGKQRSSTSRTKGELWALSTPSQPVDANFGGWGLHLHLYPRFSREYLHVVFLDTFDIANKSKRKIRSFIPVTTDRKHIVHMALVKKRFLSLSIIFQF